MAYHCHGRCKSGPTGKVTEAYPSCVYLRTSNKVSIMFQIQFLAWSIHESKPRKSVNLCLGLQSLIKLMPRSNFTVQSIHCSGIRLVLQLTIRTSSVERFKNAKDVLAPRGTYLSPGLSAGFCGLPISFAFMTETPAGPVDPVPLNLSR